MLSFPCEFFSLCCVCTLLIVHVLSSTRQVEIAGGSASSRAAAVAALFPHPSLHRPPSLPSLVRSLRLASVPRSAGGFAAGASVAAALEEAKAEAELMGPAMRRAVAIAGKARRSPPPLCAVTLSTSLALSCEEVLTPRLPSRALQVVREQAWQQKQQAVAMVRSGFFGGFAAYPKSRPGTQTDKSIFFR